MPADLSATVRSYAYLQQHHLRVRLGSSNHCYRAAVPGCTLKLQEGIGPAASCLQHLSTTHQQARYTLAQRRQSHACTMSNTAMENMVSTRLYDHYCKAYLSFV